MADFRLLNACQGTNFSYLPINSLIFFGIRGLESAVSPLFSGSLGLSDGNNDPNPALFAIYSTIIEVQSPLAAAFLMLDIGSRSLAFFVMAPTEPKKLD